MRNIVLRIERFRLDICWRYEDNEVGRCGDSNGEGTVRITTHITPQISLNPANTPINPTPNITTIEHNVQLLILLSTIL